MKLLAAARLRSLSVDQWKLAEVRILQGFARQIHDFHIELLDDGLVLKGRTKTYYVKQKAQHAVMEATDLSIIANDIVVG